ncbi:hypothetical protein D3C81_1927360 [compost metagenome]
MLAQFTETIEMDAAGALLAGEAIVVLKRGVALGRNQHVEQVHLPDNHGIEIMRDGVIHQLAGLIPVPVSLII